MKISVERLKQVFTYDPDSGAIKWKTLAPGRKRSLVAGCKMQIGYWMIGLDQVDLLAHRVAWALFYGEWPNGHIDHINGVKTDNRICNLRIATCSENMRNKTAYSNSKSGIKGVCWSRKYGKWRATISVHKKQRHIGYYKTIEEAADAYRKAAFELHGEFANLG